MFDDAAAAAVTAAAVESVAAVAAGATVCWWGRPPAAARARCNASVFGEEKDAAPAHVGGNNKFVNDEDDGMPLKGLCNVSDKSSGELEGSEVDNRGATCPLNRGDR